MNRPDIRVAVTGFGGLDRPDSGSAVARALKKGWRGNIIISALGYHPFMTEAWMPDVDHLYLLPHPEKGDDAILARVLEINSKYGLDVLVPCAEIDIPVFSRLSNRLAKNGIRTFLPRPDRVQALSKRDLVSFNYKHNISAPKSIFVQKVSDVPLYADQLGYPLFVKGLYTDKRIVYTAQQALAEAAAIDHPELGIGVVLQQSIVGDEYAVAAIVSRDGNCKQTVTMRKLAINQAGLDVCGSVVNDPYISNTVEKVVAKLDWCGPLELEFVRPANATEPYLCDINCCFPSWIMLSHWAMRNLPVLLLEELIGLDVKTNQEHQLGTIFIRSIRETTVPLNNLKHLKRFGSADDKEHQISKKHPTQYDGVEHIGTRVAITGTSTYDMINPGLGVARALRGAPGISKIYSLNYGTFDSGAYQAELFDAAFHLSMTNVKDAVFERVREIHTSHPFDVLIPCLDGELINFIGNHESFAELGIKTLLPTLDAFEKRSKLHLFGREALMDYGCFNVPESYIVDSESKLIHAIDLIGIPSVVKGPLWGCLQINNVNDVKAAWHRLRAQGLEQLIVQPKINGSMFAIAVVCDRKHEVIASTTIKKLLHCEKGSTWSAMQVRLPELESSFARYLAEIGWVGPAEGEFIRDEIEDKFYLIEVNPRFTGWISYTGALGLNHPYIAVRTALGEGYWFDKDQSKIRKDLVFMRSNNEVEVRPTDLASFSMKGFVQNGKK